MMSTSFRFNSTITDGGELTHSYSVYNRLEKAGV
jgi:hypothetical protein